MYSLLTKGVQSFRRGYYRRKRDDFSALVKNGQNPHTLFITCADSRILPEALTQSSPGDIFVMRNVGNMVPAYESAHEVTSIGSAIEYAVDVLKVSNIVVCGHSHCGACAALYDPHLPQKLPITSRWIEQGKAVKAVVLSEINLRNQAVSSVLCSHAHRQEILRATERAMIVQHLENLRSYPSVAQATATGQLQVHGWYYIIENGEVEQYDRNRLAFVPVHQEAIRRAGFPNMQKDAA